MDLTWVAVGCEGGIEGITNTLRWVSDGGVPIEE